MEGRISPFRAELLRILMQSEPSISSKVQNRARKRAGNTAVKVVVTEDGSVFFYYGRGPLWWQRLFNDYEQVTIIDASIRIADAITGSHGSRNEEAFDGMTKAILDEAIKNNDLDCVIDILFDSMRNSSNGELHSKYINEKYLQKYAKEENSRRQKLGLVDLGLDAYVGIKTSDGRILPCVLGRVNYVDK